MNFVSYRGVRDEVFRRVRKVQGRLVTGSQVFSLACRRGIPLISNILTGVFTPVLPKQSKRTGGVTCHIVGCKPELISKRGCVKRRLTLGERESSLPGAFGIRLAALGEHA